jgi:Pyruvate/2-oxoacid:ferredoxin oxidoreductase delta subunit
MEDGREILSPAAWSKRRELVRMMANYCCHMCKQFCPDGEARHKIKRGMGSGFRDDRVSNLEYLCALCHRVEESKGLRTKMSGGTQ